VTRIFLDANILFSAVYRENASLLKLWQMANIVLITSDYAVQEAVVNLDKTEQRNRLTKLLRAVTVQDYPVNPPTLPALINLPEKDIPILQAAIIGKADILLTGDISHFGRYFGKTICGIRIMRPADFLHRPASNSSTSTTQNSRLLFKSTYK